LSSARIALCAKTGITYRIYLYRVRSYNSRRKNSEIKTFKRARLTNTTRRVRARPCTTQKRRAKGKHTTLLIKREFPFCRRTDYTIHAVRDGHSGQDTAAIISISSFASIPFFPTHRHDGGLRRKRSSAFRTYYFRATRRTELVIGVT